MQPVATIARTWTSSLKLGGPIAAALGLISDLGAPIGDLVWYALLAALALALLGGLLWFGVFRARAAPDHMAHSTFAFGVVATVILSSVFGLNRLASDSPETGFLASHVEALRDVQASLVRVESKVEEVRAAQAVESALATERAAQQASEMAAVRVQQEQAEQAAQERAQAEAERDAALRRQAEAQAEELARQAEAQRRADEEQRALLAQQAEANRQAQAEQAARDAAQQELLDQLLSHQKDLLAQLQAARQRNDAEGQTQAGALESQLSAGDVQIQRQLELPVRQLGGKRVDYLLAKEQAAAGDQASAVASWGRYLKSCEDEFDPLADYAEFVASNKGDVRGEMVLIYTQRGLLCAGLLGAINAPEADRLAALQALRDAQPQFALVSLFLGRALLSQAQLDGSGVSYAKAAQELRRAAAGIRARAFDPYVLNRQQLQAWLEEIDRVVPLIATWEAQQVVAKEPPVADDCYYAVLKRMRDRDQVSEVGDCAEGSFILYRVLQSPLEAADAQSAALAVEEGKRRIAAWLESQVVSQQRSEASSSRSSDGQKASQRSFSSKTVSSSDVTQSGIQLYATQPTPEGGMEYAFLLSNRAVNSIKALRGAVRQPNADGLVCVEARAVVSMKGKDEAQAREAAIAGARLDAVGQVVGFRQRTIFAQSETELEQQTSLSVNKGYIKSMTVDLDVRRGDVYVVEISACISVNEIDQRIGETMKSMGRPKVFVDAQAPDLKTYLEGELGRSEVPITTDSDKADYVVRVGAQFENYMRKTGGSERLATRLNVGLALLDRDIQEEMCQVSLTEVRSFVGGDEQRRRDCQKQILTKSSDESSEGAEQEASPYDQVQGFLRCVRDSFRRIADEGRPVFVEIRHNADTKMQVQELLKGIRSLPGATAVEAERYTNGLSSVELRFIGNSQWLAEILERDFADIGGDLGMQVEREGISSRSVRLRVRY